MLKDFKISIKDQAKNFLLGHTCKNCWYNDNLYKALAINCMRHFSETDWMLKEQGTCNQWHIKDLDKNKSIQIANIMRGHIVTTDCLNQVIKILDIEDEK